LFQASRSFQPCGDINPVAHEVAVVLLDNVAKMDADAAASLRCV
jgi:hypothetical protein